MGERKVLNKYVPPDFDPSLVPRTKKPKDGQVSVRMMLPFSIQCSTCSTFMYRGRKFNSKKEPVEGPNGKYLGIQRFRFYIKCTACSRPVTFLTDPQNADYEMESGATRNYEVYKDKSKTEEEDAAQQQVEEKEDPMKALENRVLESQREMQDLDNLEEIKAMNMRHVQMLSKAKNQYGGGSFGDQAKALMMAREAHAANANQDLNDNGLTESEEALVKSIKFGQKRAITADDAPIRRLDDQDEKKMEHQRKKEAALLERQLKDMSDKAKSTETRKKATIVPVIKVKRKRVDTQDSLSSDKKPKSEESKDEATSMNTSSGGGLSGLLGGYASSDSDYE